MAPLHQPVLLREVVEALIHDPEGVYVDGTVGAGGHSEAIGKALAARGSLICLDRDPQALAVSRERLAFLGDRVRFFQGNFADLERILGKPDLNAVNGVLLDLGMSSDQLERSGRGFSFQRDEPLDMRMDPGSELTAADLVNGLSPAALEKILRSYGEEKGAKAIAKRIAEARKGSPIESSLQLARLIASVLPRSPRAGSRHPATRTFQALRIAVNGELDSLERFLDAIPDWLVKGGRLAIISYHSLEDRLVKGAMGRWEHACICPPKLATCACGRRPLFRRLSKRGLRPSEEERELNPRARSAVLRVAERI
jgi:16S rRNA (cytosine1402-N4)-methyltransferase